jgi:two-component system, NtrC family, sensor histidine kinase HydH
MSETTNKPDAAELQAMMQSLTSISGELMQSYAGLERRAERVEAELSVANAELASQLAQLEAILEALPVGVVVRDADGRVQRVNRATAEILGRPTSELHGGADELELQETSEPREVQCADGVRRALTSRTTGFRLPGGEFEGSVQIIDDRTELVRLAEDVHRMDKMAALGTMAAGIAHEIRNPMNAMKGFAELLKRQLTDDAKTGRWAAAISEGVDEVDAIIRSMLGFSQPESLFEESLDTAELLDAALEVAKSHTPGDLPVENWTIGTHADPARFRGDRIKLRQALRNLISNAMEVQPQGGALGVAIRVEGDQLTFSVEDAGPGLTPECAAKVVDPFYTTRADGTGLGLSLVHSIAQLHGGSLEVSSSASPLGGATIAFQIPFHPVA